MDAAVIFCAWTISLGIASSGLKIPGNRAFAWLSLLFGGGFIFLMVDRWVRMLPGVLAVAVLSALVMLKTEHLLGNPSIGVPRLSSAVAVLALVAGCALSLTFTDRKLKLLDRIGTAPAPFRGHTSLRSWAA